jgi:hypothetical protein
VITYTLDDVQFELELSRVGTFVDIRRHSPYGMVYSVPVSHHVDYLCSSIRDVAVSFIISEYARDIRYKYDDSHDVDYPPGCAFFSHDSTIEPITWYIEDSELSPIFIHFTRKPEINLISLDESFCMFTVSPGKGTATYRRYTVSLLDELLKESL